MSELLELKKIRRDYFRHKKAVLVIGFFDGVHIGHVKIIKECIEAAKKINGSSVVFTFDKPPVNVVKSRIKKKLIVSFEEKISLMEGLGVDCMVSAEISPEFLMLKPERFCRDILLNKIYVKEIFVGSGFRFGNRAQGDIPFLKEFFKPYDVRVNVIPLLKVGGEIVSSTSIRKYYSAGKIEKIARLLGRKPQVEGEVIRGSGRGKRLGFPTANIDISEINATPGDGVYLGRVMAGGCKDKIFDSLINIGNNPTFNDNRRLVEVFILNFNDNIYGGKIRITFLKKLRDEIKFTGEAGLIKQIKLDIKSAEKYFKVKRQQE
ncbi:MAG: bifunctional riboflavin kinase/FAD synthetase [Actinomycetota bacterium]|nr:bifunctional riboflavin kinase/FAD synthetase [Actinomycetota bacterium]